MNTNHGRRGRNEENMHARSNRMILYEYWIEYRIRYSLVDFILTLADLGGGFAELRTWMEEWANMDTLSNGLILHGY